MNGNQRAARQQRKRDSGPNGLKLSDRGWPRKTWSTEKARWPASVRWSALLGRAAWMHGGLYSGGSTIMNPSGESAASKSQWANSLATSGEMMTPM